MTPADGNALARDLARLLAHVGMERDVVLVGNSLGTLPTLDFAANNPERVAALVCPAGTAACVMPVLAPSEERRGGVFLPAITRRSQQAKFPSQRSRQC